MNSNSRGLSVGLGERDVSGAPAVTVGRLAGSPEDYWQRLLETDNADRALTGAGPSSTPKQPQSWVADQSWEILEE